MMDINQLNKKASGHGYFHKSWAEFFFFVLLVIGLLVAISVTNKLLVYFVIFIAGLIAGRMIFEREHNLSFPYYLIIIGFLIGFLIGVRTGDRRIIVVLFVLGSLVSFYLFDKGFIHDMPF